MELKDKTAIITGAGSGIGRAIALEFAKQGARVVCCGRRVERCAETVAQIEAAGGTGLAVACDVTNENEVEQLVQATVGKFGGLDVLFNNAASFNCIGALWEIEPESWWNDVTTNVRGPMLTSRAALKVMMKQDSGVIINMNGGGGLQAFTGSGGYGVSKAALLRFTETLALELQRVGSRVMVVAMGPGFVRTEMTELQLSDAGRKWIPSSVEALEKGKTRPPEDCARDTVALLRVMNPTFNGRIFGVGMNFEEIAKRLAAPDAKDAHLLRMMK